MKVYRGYNNEVGPISYAHWIYVTPDIEQAKWYATKDGEVEDGDIIEYDLDVEHLRFLSLSKLNSYAQDENEIYSEEDLLWYQEGLGESLYKYVAGIVFKDPHSKRDHTIYIVFSQDHLKNGRVLTKEEFEKIELRESDNNEYLDEPETPPEIGCEKVYYRGIHKFVIEHIQDDEDMGGEEYFHIYNYEKTNEDSDWYEIDDTAKYSWEDCLYYMNDFGKPQTCLTEPPSTDGSEFLDETVRQVNRELANTLLVTSAYELNEIIKNSTEKRVIYDKKNNWFLVADAETSIHINLLSDALQDGYYQPFEWNGEMIDGSNENDGGVLYDLHPNDFVLFRTSSDSLNGEDYYYDRYQYCYIYKDYCVFDRKGDFEGTPLYNYLGEPIDIENNGNVLEDEGINESLIYADRDADGNLENEVFKNPSKAEIRKNYLSQTRVVIDGEGNFYFCMAGNLIHDDIIEKIGRGENYSLFYDYYKDTFYKRDEYRNKEEHERMNKRLKEWLLTYPYIKENFGIDFNVYVFMNIEEPFDVKWDRLNESENLEKFNRIAGFYHYDTGKFEFFPRTSEDISPEDDEINQYIHNVQSEDEFTEFHIVRFGIEDIPGEGIICYMEGDTKNHVEKCYYAIVDKYQEELGIVKYELQYYVGDNQKMDVYDRYGNQVMESANKLTESVIKRDDGEVGGYYTQSTNEMINIINNKYPENDVRVLYDIDRNLYIFADTYSAIHFNLILFMILYTNVYDNIPEIKDNKYENDEVLQDIIKSKIYLATFKIFRNYTNDSDEEFIRFLTNIPENATDGYSYGYVCKINNKLWAICRDDEIGEAKQVPLLQNKTWINLKDNIQINESVNLKKLNRLAGFYHYNSGNWEMLPRTEKHLDSVDDYEEYCKYCHDYTVEDLFEEDMIRFHIEDINNSVSCAIESPYQHWIKPFIRKLYAKFPEEMAMVKKFEIEYYKEDGTRVYKTLDA